MNPYDEQALRRMARQRGGRLRRLIDGLLTELEQLHTERLLLLTRPRVSFDPCPRCQTLIAYTEYVKNERWIGAPHDCQGEAGFEPRVISSSVENPTDSSSSGER